MGRLGAEDFLAWLRPRGNDHEDLLRNLVEIDSQWSNPAGVQEVGRVVGDRLRALGFVTQREVQPDIDADDRWLADLLAPGVEYETLADTVVAHRDGSGAEPVLILGDLDTAFRGGRSAEFPFRLEGDLAFGTGVADMKAGLVVLLEALHALGANDATTPPIVIVLAGDEQAGSLGSRAAIRREAVRCRVALCLECARDGGKLMASRGHIGVGMIEAFGRESHAGTAREDGVSAVNALAQVVPVVDALTEPPDVLVTVTMIEGGRRRSVVPGSARAVVDLRALDTDRWSDMIHRLETIVREPATGGRLEVRAAVHRPGVSWTAATDDLLSTVRELGAQIGLDVQATGSIAAGSSAFAAEAGCTVLDGLGPPGAALMTDQEHVSVSGIAERAALLAALLHRLADTISSVPSHRSTRPQRKPDQKGSL